MTSKSSISFIDVSIGVAGMNTLQRIFIIICRKDLDSSGSDLHG